MKKRNLSFICAAALVLTMTACSNTTTTSTTSTSTSIESETTEAVASTNDSSTASDASQVQANASSGQSEDQNAPSDSNGTPPENRMATMPLLRSIPEASGIWPVTARSTALPTTTRSISTAIPSLLQMTRCWSKFLKLYTVRKVFFAQIIYSTQSIFYWIYIQCAK